MNQVDTSVTLKPTFKTNLGRFIREGKMALACSYYYKAVASSIDLSGLEVIVDFENQREDVVYYINKMLHSGFRRNEAAIVQRRLKLSNVDDICKFISALDMFISHKHTFEVVLRSMFSEIDDIGTRVAQCDSRSSSSVPTFPSIGNTFDASVWPTCKCLVSGLTGEVHHTCGLEVVLHNHLIITGR